MNQPPSQKQLREFGYLLAIGFPLLIGWLMPALFQHQFRTWTLFFGLPALLFAVAAPALLKYPYLLWSALGYALGWLNSHVMLGIVYFTVLLPIAIVMRIFGYDPLNLKKDHTAMSYRKSRPNLFIDFHRIF